jgi:hypothetical protein
MKNIYEKVDNFIINGMKNCTYLQLNNTKLITDKGTEYVKLNATAEY